MCHKAWQIFNNLKKNGRRNCAFVCVHIFKYMHSVRAHFGVHLQILGKGISSHIKLNFSVFVQKKKESSHHPGSSYLPVCHYSYPRWLLSGLCWARRRWWTNVCEQTCSGFEHVGLLIRSIPLDRTHTHTHTHWKHMLVEESLHYLLGAVITDTQEAVC